MDQIHEYALAQTCMADIVKAFGLDPAMTKRIVIDMDVEDVVRVYTEGYADAGGLRKASEILAAGLKPIGAESMPERDLSGGGIVHYRNPMSGPDDPFDPLCGQSLSDQDTVEGVREGIDECGWRTYSIEHITCQACLEEVRRRGPKGPSGPAYPSESPCWQDEGGGEG